MPTLTPITEYAELVKEQHALNKTIAPVETDLTGASQTYAKGAKFIYNGIMYQAKTAIAEHDALVLNTNYEAAPDVETQIANEAATRSAMGAKNFVALNMSPYRTQSTPNVSSISTQTEDELIFTTANSTFAQVLLFYSLPIGTYKVSCDMSSSDSYSPKVGVYLKNGNQDIRNVKISDGETKEFTITNEITHIEIACLGTESASTAAVRTVTFRNLMVRLATDSDGTYQPYAKTNKELTNDVSSLNIAIANEVETRAKLGAHNLFNLNLELIKTNNTSGTWNDNAYTINGITFTINSDKTVNVDTNGGTASANTTFIIDGDSWGQSWTECIVSGCPASGSSDTYRIAVNDGGWQTGDTGNGYESSGTVVALGIWVKSGQTLSNVVFEPMVRSKSDPSTEFTPYAMTNRELTDETAVKILTPTLNSSYFDNTAALKCQQMGHLVMINLAATTIAEIPNANVDLTTDANLPAPIDGNAIRGFMWNAVTKAILGQLRIDNKKINFPFNTAVPSGTSIRINFSYFAQ